MNPQKQKGLQTTVRTTARSPEFPQTTAKKTITSPKFTLTRPGWRGELRELHGPLHGAACLLLLFVVSPPSGRSVTGITGFLAVGVQGADGEEGAPWVGAAGRRGCTGGEQAGRLEEEEGPTGCESTAAAARGAAIDTSSTAGGEWGREVNSHLGMAQVRWVSVGNQVQLFL
jgi:hypothetical protein